MGEISQAMLGDLYGIGQSLFPSEGLKRKMKRKTESKQKRNQNKNSSCATIRKTKKATPKPLSEKQVFPYDSLRIISYNYLWEEKSIVKETKS